MTAAPAFDEVRDVSAGLTISLSCARVDCTSIRVKTQNPCAFSAAIALSMASSKGRSNSFQEIIRHPELL